MILLFVTLALEDFPLPTGLLVTLRGRQREPHLRLGYVGPYAFTAP